MAVTLTQLVTLVVVSRQPDSAIIGNPPGGGGMPVSTDPSAGVDMCGAQTAIAYVDVTPPGGTLRRYSMNSINVTAADDPRVESFGSITRSLTSRSGDIRGSSATLVLTDADRYLRGLEATDTFVNALVEFYLTTEAAIRAAATPRRIFSGLVTDSEPMPSLQMTVQASDYLQSLLDLSPLPTFPSRVFGAADFPNIGNDPKSTASPGNPALIGKPIPIGYGILSDESAGPLAKGVVPAYFVGKRLVNGFDWDEYVVFGHSPSVGGVLGFFGDNGGGVRSRCLTSQEGVDFLWPGHSGWLAHVGSSALYRDFNSNRYTVVYARGPRSDAARQGTIPFTINIGGCEDVGDGTGDTFDEIPIQMLHLLNNFVLQSYTSGSWLAYPVVNAYDRFRSSTFVAASTRNGVRVSGGYKGAFLLGWNGTTVTMREIINLAYRHGLYIGVNKDGQIIGSAISPLTAPVRAVSDISDVTAGSFSATRRRDEIRNRVLYRYARRYVPELPEPTPTTGDPLPPSLTIAQVDWETDAQVITNSASITKYGTRTLDLSLEWAREQATADDIADLHKDVLSPGPVVARYREPLCGTNVDLGDNVTLDEFEGISSTGWNDQLLRCESHTLDLDKLEVEIEALDVLAL